MNADKGDKLTELVADLKEDEAIILAKEMIDSGEDPLIVLQQCKNGLFEAGKRYEKRIYFISALIMGGEIMNRISQMILPLISNNVCESGAPRAGARGTFVAAEPAEAPVLRSLGEGGHPHSSTTERPWLPAEAGEKGLILLGTVKGDIHYLGKDLFKVMAQCHGYTVKDLGVDVSPKNVVNALLDLKPDIVGLSSLLHQGYEQLKQTIADCREAIPASQQLPAFIIGGLVDNEVRNYVRADFHTNDAMEGVRICHSVIKNLHTENLRA